MKVALISLDYYGYDKYIISAMKELDIEAIHIDIYANRYRYPNLWVRLKNLINKSFFNYNIKTSHLDKLIKDTLSNYSKLDKIVIIHAEWLSPETLNFCQFKSNEMIAYHYDGIQRMPSIINTFKYFDKIYSYDKEDAKKYNLNFITNYIYEQVKDINFHEERKAFNISSLDNRTPILEKIAKILEKKNYPYEFMVVNRRQFNFYTRKIKTKIKYLNRMVSREQVLDKIKRSNLMVDIQRPEQTGLTFRVFEALGLNKKLITTNKDIINYDFYNPNNILIIDPENIEIPDKFLHTKYEMVPDHILSNYHVKTWVKKILELN
ncbi:hypothetical protein Ga0061079_11114 [Apibacter mensalis]|uniref:Uncharacterized protein n=1 Tax=Apibacter mensalis TaxID=1586267 RepID=A0A0X3AR33_9FLAO|nr:hypothetical protein [Apibacter mensalis]CVK16822.1 hypothetical protein Ga0061079_11114 [Apibacter mensalis]